MTDHSIETSYPDGNGALDDDGRTAPHSDRSADLEGKRIAEYRQQSLAQADPFQAALGAANSGLMDFLRRYHAAIDRRMGPQPSPYLLRKLTPHLETYLKVARQVNRFAQLELRHFPPPPPVPKDPLSAPSQSEEPHI